MRLKTSLDCHTLVAQTRFSDSHFVIHLAVNNKFNPSNSGFSFCSYSQQVNHTFPTRAQFHRWPPSIPETSLIRTWRQGIQYLLQKQMELCSSGVLPDEKGRGWIVTQQLWNISSALLTIVQMWHFAWQIRPELLKPSQPVPSGSYEEQPMQCSWIISIDVPTFTCKTAIN